MPLRMVMIRCRRCHELVIQATSGMAAECPRCGARTPVTRLERTRQWLLALCRAPLARLAGWANSGEAAGGCEKPVEMNPGRETHPLGAR